MSIAKSSLELLAEIGEQVINAGRGFAPTTPVEQPPIEMVERGLEWYSDHETQTSYRQAVASCPPTEAVLLDYVELMDHVRLQISNLGFGCEELASQLLSREIMTLGLDRFLDLARLDGLPSERLIFKAPFG